MQHEVVMVTKVVTYGQYRTSLLLWSSSSMLASSWAICNRTYSTMYVMLCYIMHS